MDTTTMSTRTTTRLSTYTMTSTPARTTTTTTSSAKMPLTTTAMAYWPRTTTTAAAPRPTLVENLVPDDGDQVLSSSKLPTTRVESCTPLVMMDVSWPRTKQGTISRMPCPSGTIGEDPKCVCVCVLKCIWRG